MRVCVFKGGILANDEVEKASRRMASSPYPVRCARRCATWVRDKGAEYQKQARERFDRITEAYEANKNSGASDQATSA